MGKKKERKKKRKLFLCPFVPLASGSPGPGNSAGNNWSGRVTST
jgi:hypothetical protein